MNDYSHTQPKFGHQIKSTVLQDELNVVLSQLEQEESSQGDMSMDIFNQSITSEKSKRSNHQLFDEKRVSHDQPLNNPNNDIENFKRQIQSIIGGQSTPKEKKNNGDDNTLANHFSTDLKAKNPSKSRQVSIHTNAYLVTDAGDDLSHKNEMYSTMQTVQQTTNHKREHSNKVSLFTQTNNSFVSCDNKLNEERKQLKTQDLDMDKFQQQLQQSLQQLGLQTKSVQKRLVTHDQDLKLRKNLKRKIRAAVQDPAQVSMNVYYMITSYDGRIFKKFLQLSKGLRQHLLFHVFEESDHICKSFQQKYSQVFEIEKRFLSLTPISFCQQEGSRLDLSLQIRVKSEAKKLEGRSVIIGYKYNQEYQSEDLLSVYQFDLQKRQTNRWLWIHKDEALFHGKSDGRAYTIPIMPICTGDSFKLSITLLSLMGALDPLTVSWNSLQIEQLPNQNDIRDYNRFKNLTPNRNLYQKYFADLKRVCEAEDTIIEWFLEQYAREVSLTTHIKRTLNTRQFDDQFDVMKVEVGGIDFSVWKVLLRAKKNPLVTYKFYEELNIGIKVTATSSETICNEVKRCGFLIDRGEDLEVRAKDEVIVYVSMGGWEK